MLSWGIVKQHRLCWFSWCSRLVRVLLLGVLYIFLTFLVLFIYHLDFTSKWCLMGVNTLSKQNMKFFLHKKLKFLFLFLLHYEFNALSMLRECYSIYAQPNFTSLLKSLDEHYCFSIKGACPEIHWIYVAFVVPE